MTVEACLALWSCNYCAACSLLLAGPVASVGPLCPAGCRTLPQRSSLLITGLPQRVPATCPWTEGLRPELPQARIQASPSRRSQSLWSTVHNCNQIPSTCRTSLAHRPPPSSLSMPVSCLLLLLRVWPLPFPSSCTTPVLTISRHFPSKGYNATHKTRKPWPPGVENKISVILNKLFICLMSDSLHIMKREIKSELGSVKVPVGFKDLLSVLFFCLSASSGLKIQIIVLNAILEEI